MSPTSCKATNEDECHTAARHEGREALDWRERFLNWAEEGPWGEGGAWEEVHGRDGATLHTRVELATWGNEDECALILPGFLEHLQQNEKWRKGVGQKTRPWHREGVYCPRCGVRHWRTNVGSLWVNLFANRSTWRQNHASQTGARTAERAHSPLPVIWQATLVLSVFRRTCRPWAEGRNC